MNLPVITTYMSSSFSIVRSVSGAYHNDDTTLDKCVSIMRGSIKLHELCDKYKHLMTKGKKAKAKHIKKTCIPAIFTNALMFGGKSREHVVGLTGYGIIDIDHIPEDQMAEIMEMLVAFPHIVLIVRSISGKGIHIIFRYRFVDREIPS